jgi:hypothetical protein
MGFFKDISNFLKKCNKGAESLETMTAHLQELRVATE